MKKIKTLVFSIVLLCSQLVAPAMATNPYSIEYSGGEELGEGNVMFDDDTIDGLGVIIPTQIESTEESGTRVNGPWLSGYFRGDCDKVFYIKVSGQEPIDDNLSFSIWKGQYELDIQIKDVVIDPADSEKTFMIGVTPDSSFIYAGYNVYVDDTCQEKDLSVSRIRPSDGKIFVQTNTKLYKGKDNQVAALNGLYLGITDIDSAQSYKILNDEDQFTANKMYAKSTATLQPIDSSVVARNMFNADENYIYSEYTPRVFNLVNKENNIYVSLSTATQQNGLDLVFGFASEAGSSVEYYAKQYRITYESDDYGTITGITDEQVISGDTPAGSTEEAKEDYELEKWTCDKDVTLTDGTTIKVGDSITSEQITKVIVSEDLTFTAIHIANSPSAPDTGYSTKNSDNATIASISTVGVLIGAITIAPLPKFAHKKITFRK